MGITKSSSVFWQQTTIPDGAYRGIQGGYEIEMMVGDEVVRFRTKKGLRGMNIPVNIIVKDGKPTVKEL